IPTKGDRLLCGFYAIVNSIEAMHAQIQRPDVKDLQTILDSAEYRGRISAPSFAGLDNREHFTLDQLGTILLLWGQSWNYSLQLGCKRPNKLPELVPYPENRQPPTVVWIYNDDAEDLRGNIGHFSGLRRLEQANQLGESGLIQGVRSTSLPD